MIIPVILLNYNSTADCRKCISDLKIQTGETLEVIVVDNCSTEANRRAVEALCIETGCTFIANTRNAGYNAGNNVGLTYAAGKGYEFAIIANPDMEFPQTDYVARLAQLLMADDRLAVVASDIATPKGIHQNPMKPDGNWQSSFGWLTVFFRRQPKDTYSFIDNWKESHECKKVSGCCFIIRMSFLQEIGFFDEHVFLYCEESILSKQVERKGMKMFYTTEVQAVHNHQTSAKGDRTIRFKHWRDSRIYFIEHYSGFPWYGKMLAVMNMKLYTMMMIWGMKVHRLLESYYN